MVEHRQFDSVSPSYKSSQRKIVASTTRHSTTHQPPRTILLALMTSSPRSRTIFARSAYVPADTAFLRTIIPPYLYALPTPLAARGGVFFSFLCSISLLLSILSLLILCLISCMSVNPILRLPSYSMVLIAVAQRSGRPVCHSLPWE